MIFFIFNPCNTIQTYCYIKVSLYSRNHCVSFWIYGVRNTNSNFHLIWIVLIPNTIKTMYLINIQFNIIIIDCTKGVTWEIVTPRKMNTTSASPPPTLVFSGWLFLMLLSRAVNIYRICTSQNYCFIFNQWGLICRKTSTETTKHI